MPRGIFGAAPLPPGARGYLVGEQSMQDMGLNNFSQASGLLGLQHQAQMMPLQLQLLQAQLDAAKAPPRPQVVPAGGALVGPGGAPLFTAPTKPQPTSDLGRLMEERGALPPGDPRIKTYDDKIRLMTTREPEKPTKAPAGFRFTPDNNLEAIPGGPADMKAQGMFNQDTAALSSMSSGLDRLASAANEVMRSPGVGRITGMAGTLPNVPGMAGADTAAKLQTLKAQVGFNVLQEMRNASKTGGALGQVTEKELGFLQNSLAALDTAQSEDQFKESLQKIIDYTAAAKVRLQQAFNLKHQQRKPGDKREDPLGLFNK